MHTMNKINADPATATRSSTTHREDTPSLQVDGNARTPNSTVSIITNYRIYFFRCCRHDFSLCCASFERVRKMMQLL